MDSNGSFDLSCLDDLFADSPLQQMQLPSLPSLDLSCLDGLLDDCPNLQQPHPIAHIDPSPPLALDDEQINAIAIAAAAAAAANAPSTSNAAQVEGAAAIPTAHNHNHDHDAGPSTSSSSSPPSVIDIARALRAKVAAGAGEQSGKLSELAGLLEEWARGDLPVKNKSFGTPYPVVRFVCDNIDIVPSDLLWHVHQVFYVEKNNDDKNFYVASSIKKTVDMMAVHFNLDIKVAFQLFSSSSHLTCNAHVGNGNKRRRCERSACATMFCGNHAAQSKHQKSDIISFI